MKLVTALVRPHRLDDVRQALAAIGLAGMTVTEARGPVRQKGHTEMYRGAEYRFDWQPRMRIEVAVEDELTDQVVEAICNVARTGRKGDGRVFVAELEDAIRIRTGEAGTAAL